MPHVSTTSSRAGFVVLTAALIPVMAGCTQRRARPVQVEHTVARTTTEVDPRVSDTAMTTTRPATQEIVTTVVYDQGEPHYPGKYFAGGRGGGGGGGGGGGEASDVLPGFGPFGRYRVSGPFLIGLGLDFAEYEYDGTDYLLPGLQDAEVESTAITAWGEYEFQALGRSGFAGRIRPFVGAGVGVGFLDGDKVSFQNPFGPPFQAEVDGDVEIIPGVIAGIRIDLTDMFVLELGARYDYHFTDLDIQFSNGFSRDLDDFDTYGGYVGLQFRW